MKKNFVALMAFLCFVFTAAFSEAAPADDLQAANAKMKDIKSGSIVLNLTGHLFNRGAKMTINSDFSLKPKFAAAGDVKFAKKTYSFFIEDSYDKYVLYYKEKKDKSWKKNTFKKEDFDREQNPDMKVIDKLRHPEGYRTDENAVEFKDGRYFVKIDTNKIVAALTEISKRHAKDPEKIEQTKKFFSNLSPLTAEIRLDREGFVKEGSLDLTPLIKEIKERIAKDEKINKKTKRMVEAAFSDAALKFTFSDLNNVEVKRISMEE